ncbi:MAG: hypothetical protein P8Q90_04880 [Candidatus Thalassarchaeaceae archaeon]|nr:hypothetical protein [Candidatus Thalassarchaeaceae archaeon]
MRRVCALVLALSLCLPLAIAADNPGVNRTIDVVGTPIDSIHTPDVSTDGMNFTIWVNLTDAASENGTTVEWTVQQCINSGVCNPPERISMDFIEDRGKWTSTITPVDTHSYVNFDIVLTYSDGEDEKFPEGGFSKGGKVWSDCWVSGEDSGGINCPAVPVLPDESLPAPALVLTILVGLSAALIAKRDD